MEISIRIRNLLVDFSEKRTILFSTHVVEDLVATCNQLAVMKKGAFLYAGSMQELINEAKGHIWICRATDEKQAREIDIDCTPVSATLEDAYIYITNKQ